MSSIPEGYWESLGEQGVFLRALLATQAQQLQHLQNQNQHLQNQLGNVESSLANAASAAAVAAAVRSTISSIIPQTLYTVAPIITHLRFTSEAYPRPNQTSKVSTHEHVTPKPSCDI